MSMLEKMAQAIYYEAPGYGEWCDCPDNQREPYFAAARAALQAIREPKHDGSVWGEHNANNFTAVIDAILQGGE